MKLDLRLVIYEQGYYFEHTFQKMRDQCLLILIRMEVQLSIFPQACTLYRSIDYSKQNQSKTSLSLVFECTIHYQVVPVLDTLFGEGLHKSRSEEHTSELQSR